MAMIRGWACALLLASGSAMAQGSDADWLFCEGVYERIQPLLEQAGMNADADAAQVRGWQASKRNAEFALERPQGLLDARAEADRRLAAIPASGDARLEALADAYGQCGLMDGSAERDRLPQLVAYQSFCRIVLESFLDRIKDKPQAASGEWAAGLAELRSIVQALNAPAIRERTLTGAADARAAALTMQHSDRMAAGPDMEQSIEREAAACHEAAARGQLEIAFTRAAPAAKPAPATGVDLGAVFRMREVVPSGNYDGTWTRRGNSNVYDARWIYVPTGQVLTDVLEVVGVDNGELVIRRQGIKALYGYEGFYRAPLRPDGTLGPGKANWVTLADYHWEAAPGQDPRVVRTASTPAGDPAGTLFCKDVFQEAFAMFTAAGQASDASYAQERALALAYYEKNLAASDSAAHAAARRSADGLLAAMAKSGPRGPALRTAYDACLKREGADAPPSDRARQAAQQRYCASLLEDGAKALKDSTAADDRALQTEFAAASAALNAPAVVFRTDLTARDSRDAERLQKELDASLDARLGKADHDDVLGNAIFDCYESYLDGKLGAKKP